MHTETAYHYVQHACCHVQACTQVQYDLALCRSTFLGSRALAGTFIKHKQLDNVDSFGHSLANVLKQHGVAYPVKAVKELALDPARVRHYIEFHIEQGPVLESLNVPLGVVAGIAGQQWLSVSVEGVQGHAGDNSRRAVVSFFRTEGKDAPMLSVTQISCHVHSPINVDQVPRML